METNSNLITLRNLSKGEFPRTVRDLGKITKLACGRASDALFDAGREEEMIELECAMQLIHRNINCGGMTEEEYDIFSRIVAKHAAILPKK